MTYQSEHELEELLIKQLVTQGYYRVSIKDEEDLKANFRKWGACDLKWNGMYSRVSYF